MVSAKVIFLCLYNLLERFGTLREGGAEGERCVPATFRLLFFIAWKPDPSQVSFKSLPVLSLIYFLTFLV